MNRQGGCAKDRGVRQRNEIRDKVGEKIAGEERRQRGEGKDRGKREDREGRKGEDKKVR